MTYYESTAYINDWSEREELASELVPLIGRAYRQNGVVIKLFGKSLVRKTPIEILKIHRFARLILENELSVRETSPIIKAVASMNLAPASIDVGRIWAKLEEKGGDLQSFLNEELADIIDTDVTELPTRDVVLYGFGRIGRLMARILIARSGKANALRLRAVVVRNSGKKDLQKRASLLRRDSVHGPFTGTITVDEENDEIIANGNRIKFIFADSHDNIDYESYGIQDALIVDNTGKWRDEEGLSGHLKSKGASKVILTAPGKGDLPNIVYGVNHADMKDTDNIITAASCTTNAIVPVLKAVNDKFGIKNGHVETCHSYTNDQNLIDNYHKSSRRGRSAPLNMVITETGAAKAVAKALPELTGKLTGNAIRVPTPNVSLAILNLTLENAADKETLNRYLRDISLNSDLRDQIDYVNSPEVVSTDFVGNKFTGIVDSLATITDGDRAVLYVWYDNEYGYSRQVNRILEKIAGIRIKEYPAK